MDLLILDADGVFMNEMPYWRTALASALWRHGLRPAGSAEWDALGSACFEAGGVQRITKLRGCNSNWDLAAVMEQALADDRTRSGVGDALAGRDYAACAEMLARGMRAQWRGTVNGRPPIEGFGIDRHGAFFRAAVARFQDVFAGRQELGWSFPRHELAAPAARTRQVLSRLKDAGWTLAVCTSRNLDETVPPMRELGIIGHFAEERIVTHDDVLEGQRRAGVRPLGKPHWFSLAVAACGLEAALAAVRDETRSLAAVNGGRLVYVGDAPADYVAASSCRQRGLNVAYVHIDSGVCDELTLLEIAGGSATMAVVANLAEAADLLCGDVR